MAEEEFNRLALFAKQAAIAVKNLHLVTQVEKLNNQLEAQNVFTKRSGLSTTLMRSFAMEASAGRSTSTGLNSTFADDNGLEMLRTLVGKRVKIVNPCGLIRDSLKAKK